MQRPRSRRRRRYDGPLRAVILGWTGTLADHGARVPVAAVQEVFRQAGIEVATSEAREPMGRSSRDYIARIASMPGVVARWQARHGRPFTAADVDKLWENFTAFERDALHLVAELVPGVALAAAAWRARGLKIGTCLPYARDLVDAVLREARNVGFEPDAAVCADDVSAGRPEPWMVLESARRLGVYPTDAIVQVDDTPVGIEAGLNAGAWTVGVVASGNEMGVSGAELAAMSEDERRLRVERGYDRLYRAGAHYVVDSVTDLLPCIEDIDMRLARGERP